MRTVSLVYRTGKGFALKLRKDYIEPAIYYTSEDEVITNNDVPEVDMETFIDNHLFREDVWYLNKEPVKNEYAKAQRLVEKVELIPKRSLKETVCLKVTDPYDVKIPEAFVTVSASRLGSTCNCGSKASLCRHEMAAAQYLCIVRESLKEAYVHSHNVEDKSYFITYRQIEMLEECEEGYSDIIPPKRMELLKQTAEEIAEIQSPGYFDAVINFMFMYTSGEWNEYDARAMEIYMPLIGAFYMDPFLHNLLEKPENFERLLPPYRERQEKSNYITFKNEIKQFQKAEKELQKGKRGDSFYKLFILKYKGNGQELLRYYATEPIRLYGDDLEYLEFYADVYDKAPLDVRDEILNKVDRASGEYGAIRDRLIKRLLEAYTTEEHAVRLAHMTNYCLELDFYQSLDMKLQEDLAENMIPTEKNLQYVLGVVAKNFSDDRKAALILKMAQGISNGRNCRKIGETLLQEAESLSDNILVMLYLESHFGMRDRLQNRRNIKVTDNDITAYFHPDFRIKDDDGAVRTDYYLLLTDEGFLKDDDKILTAEGGTRFKAIYDDILERLSYYHFYEIDNNYVCEFEPEKLLARESLVKIAELATAGRNDESERKKTEMQEAIDFRNFEMEHQDFVWNYRSLCRDIQGEKILFTESFKVNLSYLFDFSGGELLLGFKVGNTRDYIVKNANDFLSAFRNGKTVSYGKDLTLTHDIANLNEEDRPIMNQLIPLRFDVVGSGQSARRYLPLTGILFSNVIELLKGRNVTVEDKPTLVRLSPLELKVKIDSNYKLKVDCDESHCKIILSGNKGYIYTKSSKGDSTIDYIKADADQLRMLQFAMDCEGVSIRPILNDFKRNVYSRFYDSFLLDEEIRDKFKLSVIHINAYFDYSDRTITVKTDYLKEDRKITRSDLTERMDIVKAENFENTLTGLGFENGVMSDEGAVLSFLKMDFSRLKKLASIYLSESLTNKKLLGLNRQVIKIKCSGSGIIDAMLEKGDFSEEELAQILRDMKKKKKFTLLEGDRIVDLDSAEAKEFRDTVKDLGLEEGKLYKKKRLDMVQAIKAFAHENSCSIDKQLRNMLDEIRNFKDSETKAPKLLFPMRNYQKEGFCWLSILSKYKMGGVLADDMGLGKTLQIIALIKADKTQKPSLIVCPKSLVFNWINEFARFDGETEVSEIYDLPDKRQELIKNINYDEKRVYVTSYDSLRNDIENYDGMFKYCILDEAQYIKNVTALKSKSVKEIKAEHRFALTGTPIENNILDLWSIFDFVMPGYFEELSEFKASAGQEEFHEHVAKRIGPFVLRRIKENVLSDLPEKYETILSCEMTGSQRKIYEAFRKKARDDMESGSKAFALLPILMQMRQACVDPAMCVEDYKGGSGKIAMLDELIPEYLSAGHRILIFSQFVKGLNQVEKLLKKHEIEYFMLTGSSSAKERERMIDEFNSTVGTDVFLISLKAGGTGLNLTGADTVIHLDPWWNVAAENQATDRAHRIGQTRNVEVIKLISENSIEQRVIQLQNLKKDLIDRVISNDDTSVTGATLEDIAYILD